MKSSYNYSLQAQQFSSYRKNITQQNLPITKPQGTTILFVACRFRFIQVLEVRVHGTPDARDCKFSAIDRFTICPGSVVDTCHSIMTSWLTILWTTITVYSKNQIKFLNTFCVTNGEN